MEITTLIEQDKDDNKFVDCAIVCGADYIVSNDAHFKCLHNQPFPVVNVISLDEFAADMNANKAKVYQHLDETNTFLNEPLVKYYTKQNDEDM